MKWTAPLVVLSLLVLGCQSDVETQTTEESEPYADYFDDGGYILANSHNIIIREVQFFGANEDGTVEGFNLDDRVSESGDEQTCGHPDSTDSDGLIGIDNQLASIWSVIGPLVGEATHALIKGAINEGRLLLAVELTGVDDLKNDDDVTLTFFKAAADPYVGTFGLLAPDQTYYVDPAVPATIIENVQIIDGEILAGPVEFQIPIDILDEFFIVTVSSGKIRFKIEEDGSARGYIGGYIDVKTVLEEGYMTNAAQEFRVVTPFFLDNTDMHPNDEGGCDSISAAFSFDSTPGFMVHYDGERSMDE